MALAIYNYCIRKPWYHHIREPADLRSAVKKATVEFIMETGASPDDAFGVTNQVIELLNGGEN